MALEKLPPVQKTVVLLRDYENYSYKEIAEITSLSETQVKVYIFRARSFMKTFIGNPQLDYLNKIHKLIIQRQNHEYNPE